MTKFQVESYDPVDAIAMTDHLAVMHRAHGGLRGRSMIYLVTQGLAIDTLQRPKEETR
jgi:hypothetical protein